MKNKIYIILGPTSSGKTSLAIDLCKKYGGEIISADSRQIYKYMDIGTGKLPINSNLDIIREDTYWEISGIKVWGYDLVDPLSFYSGYDWALFALNKAKEIIENGKNVFIVGGTGFYIDLFTGNVQPSNIMPDFKLRKELGDLTLSELQTKLMSLNKKVYETIDINNPVRLIRAIEKELSTSKNLSPLPYFTNMEFIYIGLKSENNYLYERVDHWLDTIWDNLKTEVNSLLDRGYKDSDKLNGLVYKSMMGYIKGDLDEKSAKQRAKYDLHSYIRRQLTYFKKNEKIQWFDIKTGDYTKNIYNLING